MKNKISIYWLSWLILSTIPMTIGSVFISNQFNINYLPHIVIIMQVLFILNCYITKNKPETNNAI